MQISTRRLGDSALELTRIGLGTWGISGGRWKFGWGEQNPEDAVNTILRAVELGINWIDTAPVYGDGVSEEHVGSALKKIPKESWPIIATKCGRIVNADGSITPRLTRQSILEECDKSLTRLGVDVIDLYQIHWPDPVSDIEDGWEALIELKKQGKVREIGVSNFNVGHLERIMSMSKPASLQPPYNLMARGIEKEILPFCGQHKIGIVAYSPLAKGMLTGKMTKDHVAKLPSDDHRSRDARFQEPQLSIHWEMINQLTTIAKDYGQSLSELAIAWTLRKDEVTSAIVGARHPGQIEANIGGANWELNEGVIDEINAIQRTWESRIQAVSKA